MTPTYRMFNDPVAFAEAVAPFLTASETVNGLLLGLTRTVARPGTSYTGRNHLALAEDEGVISGAVLMTPPFGPVISQVSNSIAVDALAESLLPRKDEARTVFGPVDSSDAFAERWSQLTGRSRTIAFRERVLRLTSVKRPRTPPGSFRAATPTDRALLIQWMTGFNLEAFGQGSPELKRTKLAIDSRLNDNGAGFLIWEDGEPVALAGFCDSTPTGVRIGPVYTPAAFRGRGYASALTAQLSQQLLDSGRSFTFLFTDVENAISNHVYEKIGYRPVTDFRLWSFSEPAQSEETQ